MNFKELFFTLWSWPPALDGSFIIVIAERPYRGISTQIMILINDLVVFESFLQTRYDVLEYLAQIATEQASGYIVNYSAIMKQLESDDTHGTGIY
jgi:Curli assembly protein CsgE